MSGPDRSRPPAPGHPTPAHFPDFEHRSLAPGLDSYVAPWSRGRLATFEVILPGGAERDPAGGAGLASLCADLLDEGTERRGGPEVADRIEALGGALSTACDWDATYVAVSALADRWEPALDLALEVATRPSFPADEVERLRRRRLTEILRRRSHPGAIADRQLLRSIYGSGPYGHGIIGEEDDVRSIAVDAPASFYREILLRPGAVVLAAGEIDPDGVRAMALDRLAAWPQSAAADRLELAPPAREGIEVVVVDRPGAAQTELRVGHPGPPRDHSDRVALAALNTLFGGKFTSRINLNLRERHGFTYGAHSRFSSRRGPGPFSVSAAVASESAAQAAREILFEMRRIQDEPVGRDELRDTVDYLIGVFPYTLQSVDGVAQRLSQLAVYGLPDDWFATYLERLGTLDVDRIQEAARSHLEPDRAVVVAVGPANELAAAFEEIGVVRMASDTAG